MPGCCLGRVFGGVPVICPRPSDSHPWVNVPPPHLNGGLLLWPVNNHPAKSKRGREEGDGTENVINCRDVCRKLS